MKPSSVYALYLAFFVIAGSPLLSQTSTLNIGLLIPDQKSIAAKQGAQLAIAQANQYGGFSGKKFQLVTRSVEGLWGAGSLQSVNLIFDNDVLAIIGSLDGRNAHLAEQVTAKTKITYIETLATDLTLSYAFVPWFFRVVPDDRHQAETLCRAIGTQNKNPKIVLLGDDQYDARYAMDAFMKIADENKCTRVVRFIAEKKSGTEVIRSLLDREKPEAVIIFGENAYTDNMINKIRSLTPSPTLYATLSSAMNPMPVPVNWGKYSGMTLISPGYLFTEEGKRFVTEFMKTYGYMPGPVSAYAYDAVNMLIRAVKKAGADREKIIEALSKMEFQGITGKIRPDKWGNRDEHPDLMRIDQGNPVQIDQPSF